MAAESITEKAARIRRIVLRLKRVHPDARLALDFRSPFELLVALILAAQCTDEKVNEVTSTLFRKYRSPADFVRVSPTELEADIRPTGFYRNKARSLQRCCSALINHHDGAVPRDLDDLLALPGVGRKTANILRGNAFGDPAIGVDTHVLRLSQRLGLTRQKDPDKVERDLTRLARPGDWIRLCHLLQFHGRRVCVARKPRCPECQVAPLCRFPKKTKAEPRDTRSRRAAIRRPGLMPGD